MGVKKLELIQQLEEYTVAKLRITCLTNRIERLSKDVGENNAADEIKKELEEQRERSNLLLLDTMQLISSIPEQTYERMIIELKYIDGMKMEDIMKKVNMSKSQCYEYKKRAIEMIMSKREASSD